MAKKERIFLLLLKVVNFESRNGCEKFPSLLISNIIFLGRLF